MTTSPVQASSRRRSAWILGLAIFAATLLSLGWSKSDEPLFVDEAAFVSQSYFWDLVTSGRLHDPRWLEYPAYDLPPLPKYLIGAALQSAGIARVDRTWAMAWYSNLHERRFLSERMLQVARWPSVIFGAIGCVALFALGLIAFDAKVGTLAALFLAINPLYRLHAMRAMADVPAEALLILTCVFGLMIWRDLVQGRSGLTRASWMGWLTGTLGGLAVLAKLNGGLGLMIVGVWSLLGLWVVRSEKRKVVHLAFFLAVTSLVSLITFVVLNPFVWARPDRMDAYPLANAVSPSTTVPVRLARVIQHRFEVPRGQQDLFPHNALRTLWEKSSTLAVQGFGRFGPLGPLHTDSTVRYDLSQDRGAMLWLPWVVLGSVVAALRGRRQLAASEPPTAWCVLAMFVVSVGTVGWFLPLAWDRFFLSIQAASALMASVAVVGLVDWIVRLRKVR